LDADVLVFPSKQMDFEGTVVLVSVVQGDEESDAESHVLGVFELERVVVRQAVDLPPSYDENGSYKYDFRLVCAITYGRVFPLKFFVVL
jgi:hypothetical protein